MNICSIKRKHFSLVLVHTMFREVIYVFRSWTSTEIIHQGVRTELSILLLLLFYLCCNLNRHPILNNLKTQQSKQVSHYENYKNLKLLVPSIQGRRFCERKTPVHSDMGIRNASHRYTVWSQPRTGQFPTDQTHTLTDQIHTLEKHWGPIWIATMPNF